MPYEKSSAKSIPMVCRDGFGYGDVDWLGSKNTRPRESVAVNANAVVARATSMQMLIHGLCGARQFDCVWGRNGALSLSSYGIDTMFSKDILLLLRILLSEGMVRLPRLILDIDSNTKLERRLGFVTSAEARTNGSSTSVGNSNAMLDPSRYCRDFEGSVF